MSIIYSYPEQGALNENDMLIGTSTEVVGGKKKNITRNFSIKQLADFIGDGGSVFNPAASDFQIGVFNQGGTKLTGSIMSQNAFPNGTGITVGGNLTANGNLTATGDIILGNQQLTNNIKLLSETYLSGQIRDLGGALGGTDQILVSNSIGFVTWTDYRAGLVYQGTWNATTGITNPGNELLQSGIGVNGHFYIVNVAGNYQLDGNPATPESPPYWQIGDWVVFVTQGNVNTWQKIDNTSALTGTGTDNKIAMWTGGANPSVTLTDSLISQDLPATTVTVASILTTTGNINAGSSVIATANVSGVDITASGNVSAVNVTATTTVTPTTITDKDSGVGTAGQILSSTETAGVAGVGWIDNQVGTVTGTGATNALTLWSDGAAGVLGDSIVDQSAAGGVFADLYLNVKGASGGLSLDGSLQIDRSLWDGGAGGNTSAGTDGQVLTSSTQGVAPDQYQEVKWVNPTTIGDIYTFGSSTDPAVSARVRLDLDATTGSDSFVTLIGSGVAITQASDVVTFTVPAGDTYDLGSGASTIANSIEVELTSGSTTDNSAITLTGAGGLTVAQSNDVVTLTAPTGSDTTYTLSTGARSGTGLVPLNLTPSSGAASVVNLAEGAGITLSPSTVSGFITISSNITQGITGSGTVNQLPKFGTTTSLVDSLVSETIGAGVTTEVNIGAQLDMTTHQIKNVVDPTDAKDAVTKVYVDTAISGTSQAPDVVQATTITPLPGMFWTNNNRGTASYPVVDGFNSVAGGAGETIDLSTTAWRAISPAIIFDFGIPSGANPNSGAPARTLQEVNDQADALRAAIGWPAAGITTTATDITFTLSFNGGQSIVVTQPAGALGPNTNSTWPAPPYTEAEVTIGTNSNPITWGAGSGTITAFSLEPGAPPADYDSYALPVNAVSAVYIEAPLLLQNNRISSVADPTQDQDAATRNYVDNIDTGVTSVATADSDLITIAGTGSGPYTGAVTATANTAAVTSISTNLATGAQIQTAINTAVANVGAFQGAYDAATNTPDLDVAPSTAIQNGWFWAVTVAGTFFSENVQIGDFIFANQDNPGATFANWTVIQSGQDIAGSGTTDGATVKGVAGFNSNDFDVTSNGWVQAKDFTGNTPGYVPDATSATAGTFLKEDGTWSAIAPAAGVGSYTTGNGTILSPQTTSVQLAISPNTISGSVFTFVNGLSIGDLVQITDGTVNGFFTYSVAGGGGNGYRFAYVSGEIPTNFSTNANVINLRNASAGGYLPLTGGTLTGALTGTSATFSGSLSATSAAIAGNVVFSGAADRGIFGSSGQNLVIRANPSTGVATEGIKLYNNASLDVSVLEGGNVRFHGYGAATNVRTGTAVYSLAVTSAGTIIQEPVSGGGTVTGTGAATQVAFWDGTSNVNGDTAFNWDNTNKRLGIGIATPGAKLDVKGSLTTAEIIAQFGNGNIQGGLQVQTNGNLDWGFNALNSRNLTFSTNQTERLRIDSSGNSTFTGNVGIGGAPLGNPGTNVLSVGVPATTTGGVQLWAGISSTHYLQFGDVNSGAEVYRGAIGYAHSTNTLLLLQNSATALSFTGSQEATFAGNLQSGNFAIGGTPVAFGVGVSTILLKGTAANNRAGAIQFKDNNDNIASQIYVTDGSDSYGTVINTQLGDFKIKMGALSTAYDFRIQQNGSATFAGDITCTGISSQVTGAVAGYFSSSSSITSNQIVHVRDNVATSSVNSAGGIKISSSPGNDVFLVKRNETTSSFFGLQNSSGSEFITVNMASGSATLGTYGSGNKTGTATYSLAVDASGNIIEEAAGGGGLPTKTVANLTGNGSTGVMALNASPSSTAYVDMYIDGVYQNKNTFGVTGSTLTLNNSVTFPNGASVETVTTT